MRPALLPFVLLALAAAACDGGSAELVITLKTDLRAGQEFRRAVTEVRRGADPSRRALETLTLVVDPDLDFSVGQRIAEVSDLEPGLHAARVALTEGTVPTERTVLIELGDGVNLVTVLITRDCAAVTCPGPDDAPDRTACHGGVCVDPRCAPDHPEHCPDFVECTDASECTPPVACMRVSCEDGTCLEVVDDARCTLGERCDPVLGCTSGGAVDAGPPSPVDAGAPSCPEGSACGPNGRICRGGTCVCPGGPPPEGNCVDRVDGDCDGMADCEDGDCRRRICVAGSPNRRCCGGSCVNIDASEDHCAGCGLRCTSGFTCVQRDGHPVCDCGAANAQCPNGGAGQVCSTTYGVCACTGAGGCGTDQTCVDVSGGPNYCRY